VAFPLIPGARRFIRGARQIGRSRKALPQRTVTQSTWTLRYRVREL